MEARIRRVLAVISLLAFFGFGAFGVLTLLEIPAVDPTAVEVSPQGWKAFQEFIGRETGRKIEPISPDEITRHNRQLLAIALRDAATERVRFSLTLAVLIPATLWAVYLFYRWISNSDQPGLVWLFGEKQSMKRGELIILWAGGILSILTLAYKPLSDLDRYGFREFADHPVKTLCVIWIFCFLVWITKYRRKP